MSGVTCPELPEVWILQRQVGAVSTHSFDPRRPLRDLRYGAAMVDDRSTPWHPLHVRGTAASEKYDTLSEGIPRYLEQSVWRWLMDRAAEGRMDLVYRTERVLRTSLHDGLPLTNPQIILETYWGSSSDDQRLELLDFLLHDMYERGSKFMEEGYDEEGIALAEAIGSLETMFAQAGSAWRIADGPECGLVRRVSETTQAQADAAATPDTDAARMIGKAWHLCYKYGPDYDNSYRLAVLAVEAASLPLMLGSDQKGTLGKVINHLKDTLDLWTVGELDAQESRSSDMLLAMLKTLWQNQQRHAGVDGTIRNVSQLEAESALNLAVTLVQLFSAELVRRVN